MASDEFSFYVSRAAAILASHSPRIGEPIPRHAINVAGDMLSEAADLTDNDRFLILVAAAQLVDSYGRPLPTEPGPRGCARLTTGQAHHSDTIAGAC